MIYILSTRVDLSFAVQKLENIWAKNGKVNFEVLVHILKNIWDNKTLGLNYYANINYSLVYDLLRQASIKTENQLMDFFGSNWKDFPDNGRSTGAYILFCQGKPIDHITHVPGPVAQSGAES